MALIDPDVVTRHDIPHEPGEWVEVRPLTAADLRGRDGVASDVMDVSFEMLARVVRGWSYSAPVSVEAMGRLDLTTYEWLVDTAKGASGVRGDAEKNASSSNSTPITAPDAERSQANSGS